MMMTTMTRGPLHVNIPATLTAILLGYVLILALVAPGTSTWTPQATRTMTPALLLPLLLLDVLTPLDLQI